MKRISMMIDAGKYEQLQESGLNVSGLIRDLIDDHLSDHKVTLSVAESTHKIYREIISNTGATDRDIEPYLRQALKAMLSDRIKSMERLRDSMDDWKN